MFKVYLNKTHMSVATVRNLQPKQGMESNAKQKCMASDVNALNVCSCII